MPHQNTENFPAINVVIPVRNAGKEFSNLICSVQNQTWPVKSILVIDTSSSDGSAETARKLGCRVHKIATDEFNHGRTRNLGVSMCDGDFVVFLTQDAFPADDKVIENLISPMINDSNIAIVYGRQIASTDADPIEFFTRQFNYPDKSFTKSRADLPVMGIKTFFCSNSCSAVRKSIFERLGRFRDDVGTNEDMLFAATAIMSNLKVFYSSQAKVFHTHRQSLPAIFRRYYAIGKFLGVNNWLLELAPPTSEGWTMLKEGISTFRRRREYVYIPGFICNIAAKAFAYKLGRLAACISQAKTKH